LGTSNPYYPDSLAEKPHVGEHANWGQVASPQLVTHSGKNPEHQKIIFP
jgi:hypothetical protein